jgi:hypothetical protein
MSFLTYSNFKVQIYCCQVALHVIQLLRRVIEKGDLYIIVYGMPVLQ